MTQQDSRRIFGAYRLKKDSVVLLQELKRAYEISYGRSFSNDELVQQLISSIEKNEPVVWDIYQKMINSHRELERIAEVHRNELGI